MVAAVRQALLEFDPQGRDKDDLYRWELSEMPLGFAAAQESDTLNWPPGPDALASCRDEALLC